MPHKQVGLTENLTGLARVVRSPLSRPWKMSLFGMSATSLPSVERMIGPDAAVTLVLHSCALPAQWISYWSIRTP